MEEGLVRSAKAESYLAVFFRWDQWDVISCLIGEEQNLVRALFNDNG